jgi:hypothetical protein
MLPGNEEKNRANNARVRKAVRMIPVPQLIVGITGAIVGVIGWLFVGIYIQRREARRRA